MDMTIAPEVLSKSIGNDFMSDQLLDLKKHAARATGPYADNATAKEGLRKALNARKNGKGNLVVDANHHQDRYEFEVLMHPMFGGRNASAECIEVCCNGASLTRTASIRTWGR